MEEKVLSDGFIYWSLFSIGVVVALLGAIQLIKTRHLLAEGEHTMGTVKEYHESDGENGKVYAPLIHFKTIDNITRIYQAKVASDPPPYKLGEGVHIIYDTADTKNVQILSYWGLYLYPIILFCIACPFLIIGGGYILYLRF